MALVSNKISTIAGRHIEAFVTGIKNGTEYPLRGLKTVGGYGNTHETAYVKVNGMVIDQTIGNIEPKPIQLTMYVWLWEKICDLYGYDNLVTGLERLTLTVQRKHHDSGDVVGFVARDCVLTEDGGDDDLDDPEMAVITITLKPTSYERLGVPSATATLKRTTLQL